MENFLFVNQNSSSASKSIELINQIMNPRIITRVLDNRVNKALEYIKSNYQHDITLSMLANYAGTSTCWMSLLFARCTSHSYADVLRSYRVSHAARLIGTTTDTIDTICFDSGFKSIRSFNREFRRNTGFTPLDFRKLCQQVMLMHTNPLDTKFEYPSSEQWC